MPEQPAVYAVNANGFTVHADAFAIDAKRDTLFFISLQGPATGVKAVFAALVNSPPQWVQLVSGHEDLTNQLVQSVRIPTETIGTWTSKTQKLPLSGATHLIAYTKLCEPQWEPEKAGITKDAFVVIAHEGQDYKKLYHQQLDQMLDIPLHPSWTDWLWDHAIKSNTLNELTTLGLESAYVATPVQARLKRDIKKAIKAGDIGSGKDSN